MERDSLWYRKYVLPGLREYLAGRRWFGSKSRGSGTLELVDFGKSSDGMAILFPIVRFCYGGDKCDLYLVPQIEVEQGQETGSSIAVVGEGKETALCDALEYPEFMELVFRVMRREGAVTMEGGMIRGESLAEPEDYPASRLHDVRVLSSEQSNSSVVAENRLIYKNFRKISPGSNPDYQVPVYLQEHGGFDRIPRMFGRLIYTRNSEEYHVGSLSRFFPDAVDGWVFLTGLLEQVLPEGENMADSPSLESAISSVLREIDSLGKTTASMHNALSAETDDPDFRPESITPGDLRQWQDEFHRLVEELFSSLETFSQTGSVASEGDLKGILSGRELISGMGERITGIETGRIHKTRIHGDYHLGQTLHTGSGFYIIDFEGEPMRSLEFRQRKLSPLKDVAGMMRSVDYAFGHLAMKQKRTGKSREMLEKLAGKVSLQFLDSYYGAYGPDREFVPEGEEQRRFLLDFFRVEKALYELNYEINNRPAYAGIPARAIARLIDGSTP